MKALAAASLALVAVAGSARRGSRALPADLMPKFRDMAGEALLNSDPALVRQLREVWISLGGGDRIDLPRLNLVFGKGNVPNWDDFDLHNVNLDFLGLLSSTYPPGAVGLNLVDATLRHASLTRCQWTRSALDRADFTQANLDDTDFSDSTMRKATLVGAVLRQSWIVRLNAAGADFTGADLQGSQCDEAIFERAKLAGAHLGGCYMTGAHFGRADLRAVTASRGLFTEAKFMKADLRGSTFEYSGLRGADFRMADLRGADLHGADLAGANLKGARLDGVNWNRAKITPQTLFDTAFTTDPRFGKLGLVTQ